MLKYRFPKSCKDQMCLLLVDIGDNVGISMLKIIFIGMREIYQLFYVSLF